MAHGSSKPSYPSSPGHPGRGNQARQRTGAEGRMDFAGLDILRSAFTPETKIPKNGAMLIASVSKIKNRKPGDEGPGGTYA